MNVVDICRAARDAMPARSISAARWRSSPAPIPASARRSRGARRRRAPTSSRSAARAMERDGGAGRRDAAGRFHAIAADLAHDRAGRANRGRDARSRPSAGLDILVNNAGIIRRADALDFTEADWDAVIDTNLKSVFFLSPGVRAAHDRARSGGKIINIASMLTFQGGIRVPTYTASKSGLAGLTRLLANEWAAQGHQRQRDRARLYRHQQHARRCRPTRRATRQILERIPAGRWGEPADIGGAAVFLASAAPTTSTACPAGRRRLAGALREI